MDTMWHPDHFLCNHCHIPLTEQFGQAAYYVHEGLPYCETDYLSVVLAEAPSCAPAHAPPQPKKKTSNANAVENTSPSTLTVPSPSGRSRSPFASPVLPRRMKRTSVNQERLSSPNFTALPRHISTLRPSALPLGIRHPRGQLEPEKRASFIMKRETREEYVRVRGALSSFQSHSAVAPTTPERSQRLSSPLVPSLEVSEHKDDKESLGIVEQLRPPTATTREEQQEKAIGKRLLDHSFLVQDIAQHLSFSEVVGK